MRFASLLLRLPVVLALAVPVAAQIVPPPEIASVPSRSSYVTGRVRILGSNLGLVQRVTIDGVDVPIVRNNGSSIAVGPVDGHTPGFFPLEVFSVLGNDAATVEFTPSLKARRSMGTGLRIVLNAAGTGSYVLRGTYEPFATGMPVAGMHYLNFIDLGAATSRVLSSGVFPDDGPVTIQLLRPYYVGLIGAPITLQAQCLIDAGPAASFTNAVTVP
jgi:hypothetical protein